LRATGLRIFAYFAYKFFKAEFNASWSEGFTPVHLLLSSMPGRTS
jgi:hypothetical protein